MRRPPDLLVALLAGLLLAAATPPWGFWIFAFAGIALLDHVLDDPTLTPRQRFVRAWVVWAALLFPSLFWMRAMTAPGYVIASAVYAGFLATGTLVAPKGVGRFVALPGGIMVAEFVRWRWPFGGVPLSNLAIGQVAGPLAPVLRLGGALLLVGVTVTVGAAVAAAWKRQPRIALGLTAVVLVVVGLAVLAPAGEGTGRMLEVAVVEGGGPQGTRAATTEPGIVLERHLAASEDIDTSRDLDLVVWPEDVVDVATLQDSPAEAELQDLARRTGATFVAGVIEDEGDDAFRNWAVAYAPDGSEIDRYEKVERVPFGEFDPFRSLIEKVAPDTLAARDATVSHESGMVEMPVTTADGATRDIPVATVISWEVFFGHRARSGVRAGAELLYNPTNGSTYTGTFVQTQQVASSRLRAIETGRWLVQVAPTGFSAYVAPDGRVHQRTGTSEAAVRVRRDVPLRTGETWYVRWGDTPARLVAVALVGVGWALDRRSRRRPLDTGPGGVAICWGPPR